MANNVNFYNPSEVYIFYSISIWQGLTCKASQAHVCNVHSAAVEEEYQLKIKESKDEIEKQKWEVFFSKEEASALEKENDMLKATIAQLEAKIKEMEFKRHIIDREREV